VKRIAILCPGRGSYSERTLRSLPDGHPWVERADALRRERDLPALSALDRSAKLDNKVHLAPENVSPLIYLVSMIDAAVRMQEDECVAVAGNSLGWYTALAAGGALDFDDGFRLVQEMSILQKEQQAAHGGGQILHPVVDEHWRKDPVRAQEIESALQSANGEAFRSIDPAATRFSPAASGRCTPLATLPKVKLVHAVSVPLDAARRLLHAARRERGRPRRERLSGLRSRDRARR
jgi:hypothetical protein